MSSTTRASGSYPHRLYIRVLARFAPLRSGVGEAEIASRFRDTYPSFRASEDAILSKDYWTRFNRWSDWKSLFYAAPVPDEPTWAEMLVAIVMEEHRVRAEVGSPWATGRIHEELHRLADELGEAPISVRGAGSVVPPERQAFGSLIHLHDSRGQAGVPFREHRVRTDTGIVVSLRRGSS